MLFNLDGTGEAVSDSPTGLVAAGSSTRPYLIRALHDWCTDNGFTPYVAVMVDASVQVPSEYVKNNEIVLNVGFEATSALKLGNETIEFKARFGGSSREIIVPIGHVIAIYARENGQGMAFPMPSDGQSGAPRATLVETPVDVSPSHGTRLTLTDAPPPKRDAAAGEFELSTDPSAEPLPKPPAGGRPSLKRVK